MILSQPSFDEASKTLRDLLHLLDIYVRDGVGSLVVANISLLAKYVQLPNRRRVQSHREFKGLDHPVMMIRPLGLVPRRRQRRRRKLQRRVIGDIELPVGHQLRRAACPQVSIGDREQIGDFPPACLVRLQPTVLEPVF